jgi:hypothetical protein
MSNTQTPRVTQALVDTLKAHHPDAHVDTHLTVVGNVWMHPTPRGTARSFFITGEHADMLRAATRVNADGTFESGGQHWELCLENGVAVPRRAV